MHKSMEILMARMESHPDEFDLVYRQVQLNPDKRWDFVIKPLLERAESMMRGDPSFQLGFLSNEEVSIVFRKLMSIQGDAMFKLISAVKSYCVMSLIMKLLSLTVAVLSSAPKKFAMTVPTDSARPKFDTESH